MKLFDILNGIDYTIISGGDININKICYDSRNVSEGDVFVCISGFKTDGHKYVPQALKNGAKAIVVESENIEFSDNISVVKCHDTRKALAVMSCNYYENPSRNMTLIGVTGTNGKTTTTYLIKSILDHIGKKVGLIGTIENRIGNDVLHTERTTPESLELQELFSRMVKEGVSHAVMEVSSHSLSLNRVYNCEFDIGIFTNLTQDHLDYHKTFENYKEAKSKLFKMCKNAVINIDDKAGEYMVKAAYSSNIITTGIDSEAILRAKDCVIDSHGVKFKLCYLDNEYDASLNIPGKFSIYNALGAIGACIFMGIPIKDILDGLNENMGVKGRFETIKGDGKTAIVDYAHTPDGLLNILKTAKEFCKGNIITVFGCGGDRDKTKRPIMGEIAGKFSTFCIITSDNPRTEQPEAILKDIEEGTKKTLCKYIKILDRRDAINYAINMCSTDDIVIVAGKGHENYQIFKDRTIHFDDAEEIKKAFLSAGNTKR